jgi:chemotaxis methyl-accepting protein methylase
MSAKVPLSEHTVATAFTEALRQHQAGRLSEAENLYRSILAANPDHVETHDALGNTLTAKGELAEARARYEQALALDPGFAEARYHLGNLLLGQGMAAEAVECYERAIALKPDFAAAVHARWHTTTFFRDAGVIECLAVRMRSRLTMTASSDARSVRVWVAGCSTGQEVYSLAILMSELTANMPAAPATQLIGTDVSTSALQRARTGCYRGRPPATISEQRLDRFFVSSNGGYQVCDSIRRMCTFSRHDVSKDPPIPDVDLISCRNVLGFFFEAEQRRRIMEAFHAALKPGGYLILGKRSSRANCSAAHTSCSDQPRRSRMSCSQRFNISQMPAVFSASKPRAIPLASASRVP